MIGNCTRRRPIRLSMFSMSGCLSVQRSHVEGHPGFGLRGSPESETSMSRAGDKGASRFERLLKPEAPYSLTPTPRKERQVVGTGARSEERRGGKEWVSTW